MSFIAARVRYLAHSSERASDPLRITMSLLIRINLALAIVFALAVLAIAWACSVALETNAKRQAMREAALMIDGALAIRAYTADEIDPLLEPLMTKRFLPQSIPFYAATQNFLKLHERHPDYGYREATLNPSNPRDRAVDWEADIIQQFRTDQHLTEIVGERDTPTGRSLYMARPIRADAECLTCHSDPSTAPATLIARYGRSNGFGWQANEIVGAQLVSVPLSYAHAGVDKIFRQVLLASIVVLGAALLLINVVLYYLIVRPVRRVVRIADEVSLGNMSVERFPEAGSSELNALTLSFNRMRTSLEKAIKLAKA
jgi:protein-histidine pros-kinase